MGSHPTSVTMSGLPSLPHETLDTVGGAKIHSPLPLLSPARPSPLLPRHVVQEQNHEGTLHRPTRGQPPEHRQCVLREVGGDPRPAGERLRGAAGEPGPLPGVARRHAPHPEPPVPRGDEHARDPRCADAHRHPEPVGRGGGLARPDRRPARPAAADALCLARCLGTPVLRDRDPLRVPEHRQRRAQVRLPRSVRPRRHPPASMRSTSRPARTARRAPCSGARSASTV